MQSVAKPRQSYSIYHQKNSIWGMIQKKQELKPASSFLALRQLPPQTKNISEFINDLLNNASKYKLKSDVTMRKMMNQIGYAHINDPQNQAYFSFLVPSLKQQIDKISNQFKQINVKQYVSHQIQGFVFEYQNQQLKTLYFAMSPQFNQRNSHLFQNIKQTVKVICAARTVITNIDIYGTAVFMAANINRSKFVSPVQMIYGLADFYIKNKQLFLNNTIANYIPQKKQSEIKLLYPQQKKDLAAYTGYLNLSKQKTTLQQRNTYLKNSIGKSKQVSFFKSTIFDTGSFKIPVITDIVGANMPYPRYQNKQFDKQQIIKQIHKIPILQPNGLLRVQYANIVQHLQVLQKTIDTNKRIAQSTTQIDNGIVHQLMMSTVALSKSEMQQQGNQIIMKAKQQTDKIHENSAKVQQQIRNVMIKMVSKPINIQPISLQTQRSNIQLKTNIQCLKNFYSSFPTFALSIEPSIIDSLPPDIQLAIIYSQKIRRVKQTHLLHLIAKCMAKSSIKMLANSQLQQTHKIQQFIGEQQQQIINQFKQFSSDSSDKINILVQKGNRIKQQMQLNQRQVALSQGSKNVLYNIQQNISNLYGPNSPVRQAIRSSLSTTNGILSNLQKGLQNNKGILSNLSTSIQQKVKQSFNQLKNQIQNKSTVSLDNFIQGIQYIQTMFNTKFTQIKTQIQQQTKILKQIVSKLAQISKALTQIKFTIQKIGSQTSRIYRRTNQLFTTLQQFKQQFFNQIFYQIFDQKNKTNTMFSTINGQIKGSMQNIISKLKSNQTKYNQVQKIVDSSAVQIQKIQSKSLEKSNQLKKLTQILTMKDTNDPKFMQYVKKALQLVSDIANKQKFIVPVNGIKTIQDQIKSIHKLLEQCNQIKKQNTTYKVRISQLQRQNQVIKLKAKQPGLPSQQIKQLQQQNKQMQHALKIIHSYAMNLFLQQNRYYQDFMKQMISKKVISKDIGHLLIDQTVQRYTQLYKNTTQNIWGIENLSKYKNLVINDKKSYPVGFKQFKPYSWWDPNNKVIK